MLASSIVLIIAVTVCVRQHQVSYQDDLFLANVEALAGTEDTLPYNCYYGGCSYNPNWDCFTTVDGYLYYCANMKTYR